MTEDYLMLGRIEEAFDSVRNEYIDARKKFPEFHSMHEGYAVIKEEFEELWDEVKKDDINAAKEECTQLAAMALAFLLEAKLVKKENVNE